VTAATGRVVGQAALHVSALATIAGEVTGNQTLKNIRAVAGKAGAIAQTVAPNAAALLGVTGQMQTEIVDRWCSHLTATCCCCCCSVCRRVSR
jgi:hypothetical protein